MRAKEIIAQVKTLPTLPQATIKLMQLLNSPAQHNEVIVKALKYDSVLTAKLLRVCNSAYYGCRESIGSIEQAILLLGHQEILRIVMVLGLGNAVSRCQTDAGIEQADLWQHSLTTALAAELLAATGHQFSGELSVAFTAGLVHDLGKLVLSQVLAPELQTTIRAKANLDGASRMKAERDVLQTDHCEVGACLLQRWHLPEVILEAVTNHHQPVIMPLPKLSALVHLANALAHMVHSSPGWNGQTCQGHVGIARILGVSEEKLDHIKASTRGSLQLIKEFMGMS